jgi:hypothetical protein
VCEIADSTNLPLIEVHFSKREDARKSFTYLFTPNCGFNEFRINQQQVGDFNFTVKNKKTFEKLNSGEIRISKVLPESERGLNLANLHHLGIKNNVEIVEINQLKNFNLVNSMDKMGPKETKGISPIRESNLFWMTILSLILLEYIIRKKMELL